MSALKKVDSDRIKEEIASIVNALKTTPDGPECCYFIQSVINCVWNGVPIEREYYANKGFPVVFEILAANPTQFELSQFRLNHLKNFIKHFIGSAYASAILFNKNQWSTKATELLVEMLGYPFAQWMGSYIASICLEIFLNMYKKQVYEINAKKTIINRNNIEELKLKKLADDVKIIENDRDYLSEICIAYFKIVEKSLRYKQPNTLLPKQLKIIFKIFKKSSLILANTQFFFDFFFCCLQSQCYIIVETTLNLVYELVEGSLIHDAVKINLLTYLVTEANATSLYCLAAQSNERITEKTLLILVKVFEFSLQMPWTPEQHCTIFLKMFDKSKNIRHLAGKLMLQALDDLTNDQKIEKILDFYMQYMKSPSDFPLLIEALWSFDYLKNIRNIFSLFRSPDADSYSQQDEILNAALCHFCVALIEKLVKDESCQDKLLIFLKYLPRLFHLLKSLPVHISILTKSFDFIDAKMYLPHTIGSYVYIDKLIALLAQICLESSDHKCVHDVVQVLMSLQSVEFKNVRMLLINLIAMFFKKFLEIDFSSISVHLSPESLEDMRRVLMKVSIFFEFPFQLPDELCQPLFEKISKLFADNVFKELPKQFTITEIYALEILSNRILLKMTHFLDVNATEEHEILQIKSLFKSNIERAEQLLRQPETSLFNRQRTLKIIFHMILAMHPQFIFSKKKELVIFASSMESDTFRLILSTCVNILCKDERTDSHNLDSKMKILTDLTYLYKEYSGFPAITLESRCFAELLLICPFEQKVNELFVVVAKSSSPFDPKYRRISTLLAAILMKWADEQVESKKVIKRLVSVFKTQMADWMELFSAIILRTISKLRKRIAVTTPGRNRVLALQLLKPFLFTNEALNQAITNAIAPFAGILRKDERSLLNDFHKFASR